MTEAEQKASSNSELDILGGYVDRSDQFQLAPLVVVPNQMLCFGLEQFKEHLLVVAGEPSTGLQCSPLNHLINTQAIIFPNLNLI